MVLVDVRRAYFYVPARRRVFVELPPEDHQAGDEHMCGLLQYSLYARRRTKLGGRARIDAQRPQADAIKGEHVVATVHGDEISIGGERSAVELLIRQISRKYVIKKQMIGEGADVDKSGKILNRVIEWGRDGITIEADQRHVREILRGVELERANPAATPCAVENTCECNARDDESNGENQRGRRRTQSKHEWDDVNESDSGQQPQMTDDDTSDITGGDITCCRALIARISCLSQDRPDLNFASMQVCCAKAKPALRDMERVKRIGRYLAGKPQARCWFRWQQSGELDVYSDADWGATRLPVGQCRLGSS